LDKQDKPLIKLAKEKIYSGLDKSQFPMYISLQIVCYLIYALQLNSHNHCNKFHQGLPPASSLYLFLIHGIGPCVSKNKKFLQLFMANSFTAYKGVAQYCISLVATIAHLNDLFDFRIAFPSNLVWK